MKFCKINDIKEKHLIKIIPYLTLKKFEKGSYLFKFGEYSNSAYYLIKGKISIRTPRNLTEKNSNIGKLNYLFAENKQNNDKDNEDNEDKEDKEDKEKMLMKINEKNLLLMNDFSKKLCKIKLNLI